MTDPALATQHDNVLSILIEQHRQIEQLFEATLSAAADERADAFLQLRRLLAVHETAEEEIVHPRSRWVLSDGDPIANARLAEEVAAKQALLALEKLNLDSEQFEVGLRTLREDVEAHAIGEEQQEFTQLAHAVDPGALHRMGLLLRAAEHLAPTRPHPGLALGGENLLAGGFAAMTDRVRDLLTHPQTDA